MSCQLAQFSDKPCDGRLIRAHLIPKNLLKRELGIVKGAQAAMDHRSYVLACGGPMGNAGHHGELDSKRSIRIPRRLLPPSLEAFAAEHGLTWYLDREYGT